MKADVQSLKNEQERIRNVLSGSQVLSFFFTLIIIINIFHKSYWMAAAVSPFLVYSLWKLWINGRIPKTIIYFIFWIIVNGVLFYGVMQDKEFRFIVTHCPQIFFFQALIIALCIYDAVKEFIRRVRNRQ